MQAATAKRAHWVIVAGVVIMSGTSGAAIDARFLQELASPSSQAIQERASTAPDTPASAAVGEGTRLLSNRQFDAARQQFERALELTRAESSPELEGRAYRGLGAALLNLSKYAAAKEALERAVTIFDATSARKDLAQAHRDLGTVEYFLTHMDAARSHYLQALAGFEAVGDVASQAGVCNSLTFVTHDDERADFTNRGLELARQSGEVETEARLLHSWSDSLFMRGRLAEATETLDLAIARFEEAGDGARSNLARALTSLGRLHRAHGHYDQALAAYQRAFTIQQALDDRTGMIQSLTAMAAAYEYLQKGAEARALRERGLALARETESTLLIDTQTAALALDLIYTDDPARGVTMLQDVVARDPFRYYLVLLRARSRLFQARGVFACDRSGEPGYQPGQGARHPRSRRVRIRGACRGSRKAWTVRRGADRRAGGDRSRRACPLGRGAHRLDEARLCGATSVAVHACDRSSASSRPRSRSARGGRTGSRACVRRLAREPRLFAGFDDPRRRVGGQSRAGGTRRSSRRFSEVEAARHRRAPSGCVRIGICEVSPRRRRSRRTSSWG